MLKMEAHKSREWFIAQALNVVLVTPDWEAARSSRVDGQQTQDDGLNDREQAAMSREGGLEEGPKLGRRRLRRKQAPPLGW